MGIWMNSYEDILETLAEALDEVEGDFTQDSLLMALKILENYPYVCDKTIDSKKWEKRLKANRGGKDV